MKKLFLALVAVIVASFIDGSPAAAGPSTDALAACLADNTTGKDRKDMARWVFVGMSAHPEIRGLSNVTTREKDDLDKLMAALMTRLMTENCPAQARVAMQNEGTAAFQAAFGVIGKLAMQELMTSPDVNSSFSRYAKYIDQKKMDSVFAKK